MAGFGAFVSCIRRLHLLSTMSIPEIPSSLKWALSPLAVIDKIYEECPHDQANEEWICRVEQFFQQKFQDDSEWKKLPCIPETPLHHLHDGQLIRFRCQVQDQYEPEYFKERYSVQSSSGDTVFHTTCFRELLATQPDEKVVCEDEVDNIRQRDVYYCISPPALNSWVTQVIPEEQQCTELLQCNSGTNKRSLDSNEEDMQVHSSGSCDNKRVRTAAPASVAAGASIVQHFNMPVPDNKAVACLVKFYKASKEHNINDMLDVVGVVCLNPSLSSQLMNDDELEDMRGPAYSLPPSVVPRLHAILCRPLPHLNPLLPSVIPPLCAGEARETRELLRSVLEEACLGDPLLGDYLVCCLLGRVYTRQTMFVVGQLPLNVSGIGPALRHSGFVDRLYALLQQLCTHSHFVPLTTANLNSLPFIPKKDYRKNELQSGVLQLPSQTLLVLDETAMMAGQLSAAGLASLEQIGNVLRNQRCKYDFQFHHIELNTDLNLLVTSEGKSLLPCECEVVLQPQHMDVCAAYDRVQAMLTEDVLRRIRTYITVARMADYRLLPAMQQALQEEFVTSRQQERGMSGEQFHRLLALARLVSVSCGEEELTWDVWRSCRVLEGTREKRIEVQNRPSVRLTSSIW